MNAADRKKYGKEYERINRKLERIWFPKVKKAIDSKVSSLIEKIQQDGVEAAIRYLNMDLPNAQLTKVVSEMYEKVGVLHARRSEKRLRQEVRDSGSKSVNRQMEVKRIGYAQLWVAFINNYLSLFLIAKITFGVNETTRDELLKIMNEGVKEGWGIDEFVSRLQDLPFTAYQAARIVRTEINRASNVGVLAQGETFEYELQKIWISVRDFRSRGANAEDHTDHLHMDGQTVDFESEFIDPRNKHRLRHPGDPEGSAEDTINCRCNFANIAKRDEDGRMIPKTSRMAA